MESFNENAILFILVKEFAIQGFKSFPYGRGFKLNIEELRNWRFIGTSNVLLLYLRNCRGRKDHYETKMGHCTGFGLNAWCMCAARQKIRQKDDGIGR